jgi:hypothetical protein
MGYGCANKRATLFGILADNELLWLNESDGGKVDAYLQRCGDKSAPAEDKATVPR